MIRFPGYLLEQCGSAFSKSISTGLNSENMDCVFAFRNNLFKCSLPS